MMAETNNKFCGSKSEQQSFGQNLKKYRNNKLKNIDKFRDNEGKLN